MINTFGDPAKCGIALSVNPEGGKYRKFRRYIGTVGVSRRVNKKAFLLFEVTLTIAVLSLGLVFVIRSISTSIKAAKATFNYNQAINLAYEKISDLELESQIDGLQPVSDQGFFPDNPLFNWKYSIEKLKDTNLVRLALKIYWSEGQREAGLDIQTYVKLKE